ncbi:hypothetical protein Cgig2_026597 [Carnegiea gigantea]|uniref:11-beta-hydroxysteroid dehydrogenase 1B n=1 Tax=Carnegiea gigantea TaxID=171969 RepID=A0A9Q1JHI6_9CARY|nr:hypothetical protein Cgig2_027956 [Carnegiea gigantea]KAJ8444393.1 hypothetical protein Cgig2_026597 [Carnegiea gigantea]
MDWIHNVLNIVAPPLILLLVCLFLPFFRLPKLFISILRSFFFTEDVANKVVIITGAASGIGEQLAYEYARRKARLVVADIRGEILGKVADTCREMGSTDAVTVTADVTDVNDCKRIVDSAITHFGRFSKVEDYVDITKARCVMDVNFWGSVYITRFAISHLRNTGGKIIVMASAASWVPMPTLSIYNASKAALVAFYETLRVEVGSDIHITIVTPGFIKSEMTKGKHLAGDGRMIVDAAVFRIGLPLHKADRCAQAIVQSACRGDRYLTEPAWYRVTYWSKTFAPELLEMHLKLMYLYLPKHGASAKIRPTEVKTE